MMRSLAAVTALCLTVTAAQAEVVGEVDTAFKLLGANHKIVVEAFDDPKIAG
ncbi:MAG: CreA family protein, partial [Pseudomonadota bacterium]